MIVPVTFRILVAPVDVLEEDEQWKSAKRAGIDLSGTELELKREQNGIDKGHVVACGPTAFLAYDTPNPLQVGDLVVFARHAGKQVTDPDDPKRKLVVINDEDVVAIIKKDSNE